jgi:hypothetical protein
MKLLGLLIIVGGFIRLYSGVRKKEIIKESKNWPTVAGKIVSSSYLRKKTYAEVAGGGWMKEYYYEVFIKYDYSISGTIFTSDNICFDKANIVNSSEEAIKMVEKYPKDGNVTVYYKPGNPNQAILESRDESIINVYIQAIALLGFGIYLLIGSP